MNQLDTERRDRRAWADGDPMPDSGMQHMLGIGIALAAIVVGLVFYNATSDHPATATNATANQHAGAPPQSAPAPQTH